LNKSQISLQSQRLLHQKALSIIKVLYAKPKRAKSPLEKSSNAYFLDYNFLPKLYKSGLYNHKKNNQAKGPSTHKSYP